MGYMCGTFHINIELLFLANVYMMIMGVVDKACVILL